MSSSKDVTSFKRILKSAILCSLFLLVVGVSGAYAAVPQIAAIANDSATQGSTYTKTPALAAGGAVRWTKEFGPDDMTVNPTTGAVSWSIPSSLPRESFHLGVRATNSEGSTYITWILKVGGGNYIYVGPSDTYKTISAGTAAAAAGDTVVIRDGLYTGTANMMNNNLTGGRGSLPPQGSAGMYSTVMAEHPGGATIDGQGTNYPIYIVGHYVSRVGGPNASNPASYLAFKGLVACNSGASGNSSGPIEAQYSDHIKFIDCGAYDAYADSEAAPIYIARSGYMLVEGCYAYGRGRMMIIFYICDNSIMRRNVARQDFDNAYDPIGVFDLYACQNCRANNNVAVDCDQISKYSNWTNAAGVFISQSGSGNGQVAFAHKNANFYSNIALNVSNRLTLTQSDTSGASTAPEFHNCVAWGMNAISNAASESDAGSLITSPDKLNVDQCTFGKWRSPYKPLYKVNGIPTHIDGWNETQNFTNSIMHDFQDYGGGPAGVFGRIENAAYNDVFGTGTVNVLSSTVSYLQTMNPTAAGLKYLPRIEPGSALATGGQNGTRIGANIMTMRGASGTLWGEANYDTETSAPMWPFPHEELIKKKMSAYTNNGVNGNRGFASTTAKQLNGQPATLTSYIWEYLGNAMPSDIYGAAPAATPGDTTAPSVAITAPAANSTVTGMVSVTTAASDAVGVSKVEFYVNGALQGTDTATPYNFNWDTSALAAGSYTLTAKAYDAAGNVGQSGSTVVSKVSDTTVPTVAITSPTTGGSVSGTVTVNTSASDNVGVSKIEIYQNGVLKTVGNTSPLSYSWNTAAEANGTATLTAKAYDAAGNVGQSSSVTVTISNTTATPPAPTDTTAPSVAVTSPAASSTVSGTASVTASASDNVGVSKVEFYVDGALKSTATAAPYSYSWGTTAVVNGAHTLSAKAYDAAGNAGQSASVSVNVSNAATAPAPAAIAFIQVGSACPQSATQTVMVNYPKVQTAGNFNIIVVGRSDAAAGVQSVTDSLGNVYTMVEAQAGTGVRQSIYYAKSIKGGTNQVKVVFNSAAAYPDIRVLEYSGLTGVDQYVGAAGSGSTCSTGSVTTTSAKALLFAANTVSSGTAGAGSGFTTRIITSPDSDIAQDRILSATGTYSASAPLTASGDWVMQLVAFK